MAARKQSKEREGGKALHEQDSRRRSRPVADKMVTRQAKKRCEGDKKQDLCATAAQGAHQDLKPRKAVQKRSYPGRGASHLFCPFPQDRRTPIHDMGPFTRCSCRVGPARR
jgi:hypothetical protein